MNVIFISDFIHLFHVSNPVHVKMIERKTPVFVFLHDRKGRTYNILTYSKSVTSRHPSGLRLFELADVVLDNHGEVGDAAVAIEGLSQRVSPTSTVVGAVMLNSIVAALVQRLVDEGMEHPPVFYSANLDGGDELNQRLVDEYRDCIHYRF